MQIHFLPVETKVRERLRRFHRRGAKDTKNEFKKINHKGHKEHIGREARKIKFLRRLRSLRLNHPKGTAIAVPFFVTFVLFVVKSLSFGCGFTELLSPRFFSHKIAREINFGEMAR
ncbi:MAG TPA: hypothetical protein VGB27_13930 [Candidatus Binatia bacterium]